MYAGGYFSSPGNNIIQWNDITWKNLGSGINGRVCAIGIYKDTVYMGGYFSSAGGHSAGCVTKWDGTSFANAGFDVEGGLGQVNVIQAYNNLLYIGGEFDSVNHKRPSGLVTWNGNKVDSLHIAYGGDWNNVCALSIYKNELLMGFGPLYYGTFGQPIVGWNNKGFSYPGNGYFYTSSNNSPIYMTHFCLIDTEFYVGGSFLYFEDQNLSRPIKDTVNNIAMWNGKEWSGLGKGINGTVYALVSYHNLIVAGGSFDSASGIPVNNIAAWNGVSWEPLGNGLNGTVYTLAVFDSNLYAGGNFSSPGNGIAKFNPTLRIPSPIINNDSINIFPNPNNGQFTIVCNRAITTNNQPILEIYNNLGQKIYSANLTDSNNLIDIGKQAKGIYIYKITSSGTNLINPGKFVID